MLVVYNMWRLLLYFLIGLVSALAGVGGGVFFVPLLIWLGYSPSEAVGISAVAVAITTSIGGFGYYKERLYDPKTTLRAALVAYPGVILGVLLTVRVPQVIKPAIGAMLFLSAYRAFRDFRLPKRIQYPGFFITGFFVGLLGIGGGAILTPIILSTVEVDVIYALGIAYTTMPLMTIVAALLHVLYGGVNIQEGLYIGILASLGSYTGSKIAGRIRNRNRARYVVGAIMFIVGIYVVFM